jgi:glucosamine-6-phosphate deaminase
LRIIIEKSYEHMSKRAAELIAGEIRKRPDRVICFPTGSTPEGTYHELSQMYRSKEVDFSHIVTFNLDEYIGLEPFDQNSYHHFMFYHLFDHINVKPENIHIPDGYAKDLEQECKRYDKKLDDYPIKDILLTGIGENGHIGFNEPGNRLFARTHIAQLTHNTLQANARLFNDNIRDVPSAAITMGVSDIMHFNKIVIIANGDIKAPIVSKLVKGKMIDPHNTSSLMYLHNDVVLIIDEEAGSLL